MITLEYYLSRVDRNLFSDYDDEDNLGQGYEVGFNTKQDRYFLRASHQAFASNFVFPGRKYEVDYQHKYHLQEKLRSQSEASAGYRLLSFLSLAGGYGLVNSKYRRSTAEMKLYCTKAGLELLNDLDRYYAGFDTTVKWFGLKSDYRREIYEWTDRKSWFSENEVNFSLKEALRLRLGYDYERDTLGAGRTRRLGISIFDYLETDFGLRNYIADQYLFASCRGRVATKYFSLNSALEKTNTAIQKLDEVFRKVGPGQGNYVKDPVTAEFLFKKGGDYVKEIIRLEDFERVSALRYSLDLGSSPIDILDMRTAIDGLNEELYDELGLSPSVSFVASNDLSFDINSDRRVITDRRYFGEVKTENNDFSFEPRFKQLRGHFSYFKNTQWQSNQVEEMRRGYENWLIQDIRLRLDWWLKGGYNCITTEMPYYYPGLGQFYLYEPNGGLGVAYPVSNRGRIEASSEYLYRLASIDSLPFSLEMQSPLGLTQVYTLSGSYNVNDYTVMFVHYRAEKLAAEKLTNDFRAEVKIRF